ncbi:MAG: hypothetical protein LUH10_03925 [Tannerellaceae bacterium]|nr:hypothetical protein [Tannerellaceae bacterium]
MKIWKKELTKVESLFGHHEMRSWITILKMVQNFMNEYPDDVELNIRVIYLLHNILLEEGYPHEEHDLIADLLKRYFDESYERFSENAEYLFFIGKILYIAEWYFGLKDDDKPIEESLAFQMQKKALEKEPDNILYKWGYALSGGNKNEIFILAKRILYGDNTKWLDWLKTKGFPGEYTIEGLIFCYENYKGLPR